MDCMPAQLVDDWGKKCGPVEHTGDYKFNFRVGISHGPARVIHHGRYFYFRQW